MALELAIELENTLVNTLEVAHCDLVVASASRVHLSVEISPTEP